MTKQQQKAKSYIYKLYIIASLAPLKSMRIIYRPHRQSTVLDKMHVNRLFDTKNSMLSISLIVSPQWLFFGRVSLPSHPSISRPTNSLLRVDAIAQVEERRAEKQASVLMLV